MEKRLINKGEQELVFMTIEEFVTMEEDYPQKDILCYMMDPIQYCKAESYRGCVQGTMRIPTNKSKGRDAFSFGFHMNGWKLLIIENGDNIKQAIDKIDSRLNNQRFGGESDPKRYLLLLFEYLIEDDVMELQNIEHTMEKEEELLLEHLPERFYKKVIEQRKQLSQLHSYYEQLTNVGDLMQDNYNHFFNEEECGAWIHYTGRTERLHNHVEQLMEYLVQIRDLYQTQIDKQQNKVMTFLTVVTTVFMPLTLIAGWYGMNFVGMPELKWIYGYPLVIAISIIIIIAEIIYFKKKRML